MKIAQILTGVWEGCLPQFLICAEKGIIMCIQLTFSYNGRLSL